MLPQEVYLFDNIKREVVGNVLLSDSPSDLSVYLQPDATIIGPMKEPMPKYIMFKQNEANSFGAELKEGPYQRIGEELVAAGIHRFLLMDPRIYLHAEREELLEYQKSDEGSDTVVLYDIIRVGTDILGMPKNIAQGAAHDAKGPFRTSFRVRDSGLLELRINEHLINEENFAQYNLQNL